MVVFRQIGGEGCRRYPSNSAHYTATDETGGLVCLLFSILLLFSSVAFQIQEVGVVEFGTSPGGESIWHTTTGARRSRPVLVTSIYCFYAALFGFLKLFLIPVSQAVLCDVYYCVRFSCIGKKAQNMHERCNFFRLT